MAMDASLPPPTCTAAWGFQRLTQLELHVVPELSRDGERGWDGMEWVMNQPHLSGCCHRRCQPDPRVPVLLLPLLPDFPTFPFAPGGTCCFIITGQGADQPHSSGRAVRSCCPHAAWLIRLSCNQRAYLLLELSQGLLLPQHTALGKGLPWTVQ